MANTVTDGDGNTFPVNGGEGGKLVCDFCSRTPIRWRYPARDFQHNYTLAGLSVQNNSTGDWAACEECHKLIEADDRDALVTRSYESFPIPHADIPPAIRIEIKQSIRGMQDTFWSVREGAPAPIALEGTMNTIPTDVLWAALRNSTTINDVESIDHGPAHWARVRENGMRLGRVTPSCDLLVVDYFALFHDTMRENDFDDPEHGARAVQLAIEHHVPDHLSDTQWFLLASAMEKHDRGERTSDPTIGVCWDADRLDLTRLGMQPLKRFFSTTAGTVAVDALATL